MGQKAQKIEDLSIQDFEEYCDSIYDGFEILQKYRTEFIKYRGIEDPLKIHLLLEMFDFFYLEDDAKKCHELNSILKTIYTQNYVRSWIYKS